MDIPIPSGCTTITVTVGAGGGVGPETKPKHHQVPVVRINEIKKHPNADTLGIVEIDGYQAIIKLDDYKVGDLAYYIPPDNVVPERKEYEFLWSSIIGPDGTWRDGLKEVPVKYRRIKARKFRKEWSEGLLMPLDFSEGKLAFLGIVGVGQDISDQLGITHYQPPDPEDLRGSNERGPGRLPRTFKGWVYWLWYKFIGLFGFKPPSNVVKGPDKPHYDIENFKNYKGVFEPGEQVMVTEKIHGCQGRFVYQDGHMYAGSRNWWKSPKSKCIWRKCLEQNSWIVAWCAKHEGYTLYGEIVPCQGSKFMYGKKEGEVGFLVFDIHRPIGDDRDRWVSAEDYLANSLDIGYLDWVPILYQGPFDPGNIKLLAEGKSVLNGSGIREGVVIKPLKERGVRGLGRVILKVVGNTYLEKSE